MKLFNYVTFWSMGETQKSRKTNKHNWTGHDAPLLKCSQWDMNPRGEQKEAVSHTRGNRGVPSGVQLIGTCSSFLPFAFIPGSVKGQSLPALTFFKLFPSVCPHVSKDLTRPPEPKRTLCCCFHRLCSSPCDYFDMSCMPLLTTIILVLSLLCCLALLTQPLSGIGALIVQMTAQTTGCKWWKLPFWLLNNEFHSTWPPLLGVVWFFGGGFQIQGFPTDSPN